MVEAVITRADDAPQQEPAFAAVPAPTPVEEVAVDQSKPMFSLRGRREQIVSELYVDLQVPRWENPKIFVRYTPIGSVKLTETINKRSGANDTRKTAQDQEWPIKANADILISACEGIYGVWDDAPDQKFSLREGDPYGKWTKFDVDLASALGSVVPEKDPAVATVRSLYLTDGDLGGAAEAVLRFSNLSNSQADTSF